MKRKLTCDVCERVFSDPSPKLAADMLAAHKEIAHRPEPEPFIPDEHAETARVLAYRPRANFRYVPRDWPPDPEPTPTGTDGGATAAQDGSERAEGTTDAPSEPERPTQAESAQTAPPLTASRETLRALKLINDAAVLAEKQLDADKPKGYRCRPLSDTLVRVTLAGVETVINVRTLDKWVSTFEPSAVFTVEMGNGGYCLTLTRDTSFIRFMRQGDIFDVAVPVELTADESGTVIAPALPSPESLKAARKSLAEARKAAKAEKVRQNMLKGVNSARADVKRAEEYAAKLEEEAREAVARAEELTEEDCDEAVTLAKRVRDLRRLHRAVKQAAEDPQINTPEFFEWLTDEHKAAYAEAFEPYAKAAERERSYKPKGWGKSVSNERKRRAKVTEAARSKVALIFLDAWRAHVKPQVEALDPDARDGWSHYNVLGAPHFDAPLQKLKHILRRLPRSIERARKAIPEAREKYHAALLDYAPHVRADERERYERLVAKFEPETVALARAA